jgi:hypothetical protein
MHYELWDIVSRNMLMDFGSETEALTEIRALLDINTPDMADELVLLWRDGADGGTVAEGATLAARARNTGPERGSLPV